MPHSLYTLSYQVLTDLVSDQGVNASARTEAYGCIFGRDSAITVLKLLRTYQKNGDTQLLAITRRTLETLVSLQGRVFNLESGEEPGKGIHEFRTDSYDHLVHRIVPWYVYPDHCLRNYDSVDATPLLLIALYRYWQASGDNAWLLSRLPAVEAALKWIMVYGDKDHDHLIEYELPSNRTYGGLTVQSWTDSKECLLTQQGVFPHYPIAAVEVQGYCWLALRLWTDFFLTHKPALAVQMQAFSRRMKEAFNQKFVITTLRGTPTHNSKCTFLAQAVDGVKQPIKTITANPLLTLWASYTNPTGKVEAIVEDRYIPALVTRAFDPDIFVPTAGLRTMSALAPTFNAGVDSYHNGSFWPMLNGLIHEGLSAWGFQVEADELATATLLPIEYFQTPIELYIHSDSSTSTYAEYQSASGKRGCRQQAWTAAAILDLTS